MTDKERIKIAREADAIFMKFLVDNDYYDKISQAYAGLLSCKSVGVVGDQRRYGYIIMLRCVETGDFMTANAYNFQTTILSKVATEIVNKIEMVTLI